RKRRRPRSHRPRQADDLVRPLSFHCQADEQPRDLRRLRLAVHDRFHRAGRLVFRQIDAALELVQQRWERDHEPSSRKLRRIWRPPPVGAERGWTGPPGIGTWGGRNPTTPPSSGGALISSVWGTGSGTRREG